MANLTFEQGALKVVFETGIDEFGDSIFTSKTYKNVRSNVTADRLAGVVQAFIQLSKHPLVQASISRTEKIEL
ncbi:DUF1659 domain-containing protein [Ureibacillus sp. FSL K6-8385]|uniref:DUF1659 domain-containing protein n=1 Tax=Ureibacillus terrenus TaxID=118246 RepID=A0A540V5Y5_9BACL|nr:DUF1659 domain-containing protein [Ureibacillus terrenus]MED3660874.1 DUF1659 domain-containing protein [Ureibacillus terrenus]MED3764627.1 DUF1659 domain-containing protein [Ureibacillus terrenus]TQE92145.1 DUF1659 domain-containing protein [Ureibacillus terrenus]